MLAVETYCLRERFGDIAAIKMIHDAGFEGIDYSFYAASKSKNMLDEDYLNKAYNIKKLLKEYNVKCNQTHAPYNINENSLFNETDSDFAAIVHAMEFSAIIGAKTMIVHAINTTNDNGLEDINYRYYKSLEPYCRKYGVKVGIENLFRFDCEKKKYTYFFSDPNFINAFLDKLSSPWYTACVDIGHITVVGDEPCEFINTLKTKYLTNLHIHDNDLLEDLHTLPYLGKIEWNKIISLLGEKGYSGDYTFEIFGFLGRLPECMVEDGLKFAYSMGKHIVN